MLSEDSQEVNAAELPRLQLAFVHINVATPARAAGTRSMSPITCCWGLQTHWSAWHMLAICGQQHLASCDTWASHATLPPMQQGKRPNGAPRCCQNILRLYN